MLPEITAAVQAAVSELFGEQSARVELTRPDEQFGDFATNVALQLAGAVGKSPREIAEALAVKIRENLPEQISAAEVAGPGFINLRLTDQALIASLNAKPAQPLAGQEVIVEFGDPNPFKAMHIGHLYSYVVGDAICYLLQAAGATIKRLSYHGDVGLHVAKAIWGMQKGEYSSTLVGDKIRNNIGHFYTLGAKAYEQDDTAKTEIDEINQKVYMYDPDIQQLYDEGKSTSLNNFLNTLTELGIHNDKRYFESESAPYGVEIVRRNIGPVFVESEGAIVYEGEKAGLHTRVFITSKGLPTYEAKDLGLTELKKRDFPQATRSIIITANEQAEYFKVMLAALKEIDAELANKTQHLTHGFVSLSTGKMSSRTGDVYGAVNLIVDVEQATEKLHPGSPKEVQIGAIKYAFIKHRLGGDIVYDIAESVSLEGNSGPYLQYAHARARSILRKAEGQGELAGELQPDERSLARKISEFTEVVDRAVSELMPHHICTYLYELAQAFNRFYEHNRVIGDDRQAVRLALVQQYADKLKTGLELLGIAAPDHM